MNQILGGGGGGVKPGFGQDVSERHTAGRTTPVQVQQSQFSVLSINSVSGFNQLIRMTPPPQRSEVTGLVPALSVYGAVKSL